MSPFRMATFSLGLLLPLAATAQTSPPAAARPAATNPAGVAPRERATMTPEQRAQRMEAHLTQLRTQLAITPAQQAPWDAFAKVSRDNATELHDRFQQRETQFARITAAENMADYAAISELHAAQLRRLAVAFQALYATLSPEQQRNADTVFRTRRNPGTASG